MDDLFLKIIAGEIPSAKIYEDDHTVSFLDIRPANKGHALVVSREKFRNIFDADPEKLGAMIKTAQKVAKALRETIGAEGVNIVMNNEHIAGQEIFHAHIHVIPRFKDDGIEIHPRHLSYEENEISEYAEKIRKAI